MAAAIVTLFPRCPPKEARQIAGHAAVRGSGRFGRSAAERDLEEDALTAAVIAHTGHCHTRQDKLLMAGSDRDHARLRVRDGIDEVLERRRKPETEAPESADL